MFHKIYFHLFFGLFSLGLCAQTSTRVKTKALITDARHPFFMRACHYPHFADPFQASFNFRPDDYTPGLCTHMIFGYGKKCTSKVCVNRDATKILTRENLNSSTLYEHLVALKKKDEALLTMMLITPTNEGALECLTCDAVVMEFAQNKILALCREAQIDGIVLSWGDRMRAENFTELVRNLRSSIDIEAKTSPSKTRIYLAIQLYPGRDKEYEYQKLERYVDFVLARGRRSTDTTAEDVKKIGVIEKADPEKWKVETIVEKLLVAGMPARKIVVTVPINGIRWTPKAYPYHFIPNKPCPDYIKNVPNTVEREELLHKKVWDEAKQGLTSINWSEEHGTLFANNTLAIQSQRSLTKLMHLIRSKGLAGAYSTSLNNDDYTNNYPLIQFISDSLKP